MPITPTYPGVYIQELPSGVRTITGVSTSVTAFVGAAKRGPIEKPVRVLSYADYERRFGGLSSTSEMSYSVRQYFLNGGSEAWVVRVAKSPQTAFRTLQANDGTTDVITVSAVDSGSSGNDIELRVDYATGNPASTFSLTAVYAAKDNPADSITERFDNLSMNSADPRYFETVVNNVSKLVTVKRAVGLAYSGAGNSTSGSLLTNPADNTSVIDAQTTVDATHASFNISVDGADPVLVTIVPQNFGGGGNSAAARAAKMANLCTALATAINAASGPNVTVAMNAGGDRIIIESATTGEKSSVHVTPSSVNDLSARLKLGTINGGTETDAAAGVRPRQIPLFGRLVGAALAGDNIAEALPTVNDFKFRIRLDGNGPDVVVIDPNTAVGVGNAAQLAARIQTAVRKLYPSKPAYSGFTATYAAQRLTFSSGTRGKGSSVQVDAAPNDDIATELLLLSTATSTPGENIYLQMGSESDFDPATEAFSIFIGDRNTRKGIYALESVDLFNLMCLPGIVDTGLQMEAAAYCSERRAFLIADMPPTVNTPEQAVTKMAAMPKTPNGAVYFPWIKIADPLRGGTLRVTAPSGTIAGLYARTDSSRGIWKAPAGTDASLVGVQALDYTMTDRENGTLNPLGVNGLRFFPAFGAVSWGARTLVGSDAQASEWKYIPVRRLALYLEESLYRGTQWVVFEPNDEPLWAQIRLNIGAFMHSLFRQGAFQGKSPNEAYFVRCSKDTTTQDDINRGIVNIIVGFAPLKPAEFVIISIQQMAGQIQA
jgi:uncharacterized protein